MSGDLRLGPDRLWSARSSVFAWVLEQAAELLADPALAAQVREVADENLGWLDVAALPPEHSAQVRQALQQMPEVGRRLLPDTRWKADLVRHFEELAVLAEG